jgi:hypothetical protein
MMPSYIPCDLSQHTIRARLGETLAEIRAVADQELTVARARKAAGEDVAGRFSVGALLLSRSSERRKACCAGCAQETAGIAYGSGSTDAQDAGEGFPMCGVCAPAVPEAPMPVVSDAASMDPDVSAQWSAGRASADTAEEEAQDTTYTTYGGGEVVCHNFRELLWYWQEYYLRRGRDRLSVEFSSHIPFRYWNSIVGE